MPTYAVGSNTGLAYVAETVFGTPPSPAAMKPIRAKFGSKFFFGDFKTILTGSGYENGRRGSHLGHSGIAKPVRRRYDHFVTRFA